jgi:polyhydroxyalkanoate synthesis regulator phasin
VDSGRTRDDDQDLARGERRVFADLAGELWSQALLTAGAAEGEARRLIDRLAGVVNLGPDDVQRFRRELAGRLRTQRRQLQQSIDGAINDALLRLRLPSRTDFAAIRRRVADLGSRLDQLETRKAPPRPASRRAQRAR